MISFPHIILMFWVHFIADFFLQSEKMGMNKHKDSKVLAYHCGVYSLPFIIVFGWKFALLAGLFHFPIDFISSRCTHKLYDMKQYHWFFVVIGLDQAIHMTILFVTLNFLV